MLEWQDMSIDTRKVRLQSRNISACFHWRYFWFVGLAGDSEFGSIIIAVHLSTERVLTSLEKLMVVGSHLTTIHQTCEVPSVQLSGETGVLALLEVFRQDVLAELSAIDYNETSSIGMPSNGVVVGRIFKDIH